MYLKAAFVVVRWKYIYWCNVAWPRWEWLPLLAEKLMRRRARRQGLAAQAGTSKLSLIMKAVAMAAETSL